MIRELKIQIECGETTCASTPGKFCNHFGTIKFGMVPICVLFSDRNFSHTILEDKDGWIQRCEKCMNAETKND